MPRTLASPTARPAYTISFTVHPRRGDGALIAQNSLMAAARLHVDFVTAAEASLRRRVRPAACWPLTTFLRRPDWLIETRTSDGSCCALNCRGSGRPGADPRAARTCSSPKRGRCVGFFRAAGGSERAVDRIRSVLQSRSMASLLTISHGRAASKPLPALRTVGGAVFGNAHFGGRLIGDLVTEVRLVARDGTIVDVDRQAMAFAYDRSRLQDTCEILLSAVFCVSAGNPAELRARARASLAFRKRTQPLETPSAGCIFQNPQPGLDVLPDGMPWSAGALVDRAGMKGAAIGGARVSPTHGNFIINDGPATAAEIKS